MPSSQDSSSPTLNPVATLGVPIYFSKSSISRNPHIKYWDGTSKQEDCLLHLIMNASSADEYSPEERPSCGPGQVLSFESSPAISGKKETVISSPVVMCWKVPMKVDQKSDDDRGASTEMQSWRKWDQVLDGLSDDVKAEVVEYEQQRLRGEFIGNSFSVPIRSDLDWTRKAFLTC
ncbi:uncharacterized protein FIESC28_08605 [Fusarium coffeatum]|uniref:Uncharacterized protein n=1 Tax=Fusarium coffeatum TaxID=231269 RepID=A0A366R5Q4_9HYPO|nr:uncharacterized protein FIESC28_08605 [Fusarium coffeatum]RBR12481.1 hypothetical protein FIESC28_08605 [Fusarium coffeatum]